MRYPRNAKAFRGHLDAAPLAGVFFLLVLFLLLNSSLVFTPGVKIELPQMDDWPGTASPSRLVALDLNGQLYYDNQVIGEDQLKNRLREAVAQTTGPLTLIVQADKAVKLDAWMRLSALAREVGISQVLLAARPPSFVAPEPARP